MASLCPTSSSSTRRRPRPTRLVSPAYTIQKKGESTQEAELRMRKVRKSVLGPPLPFPPLPARLEKMLRAETVKKERREQRLVPLSLSVAGRVGVGWAGTKQELTSFIQGIHAQLTDIAYGPCQDGSQGTEEPSGEKLQQSMVGPEETPEWTFWWWAKAERGNNIWEQLAVHSTSSQLKPTKHLPLLLSKFSFLFSDCCCLLMVVFKNKYFLAFKRVFNNFKWMNNEVFFVKQ